jgi:hypothetical protein
MKTPSSTITCRCSGEHGGRDFAERRDEHAAGAAPSADGLRHCNDQITFGALDPARERRRGKHGPRMMPHLSPRRAPGERRRPVHVETR